MTIEVSTSEKGVKDTAFAYRIQVANEEQKKAFFSCHTEPYGAHLSGESYIDRSHYLSEHDPDMKCRLIQLSVFSLDE